jgi:hypothetical protein
VDTLQSLNAAAVLLLLLYAQAAVFVMVLHACWCD